MGNKILLVLLFFLWTGPVRALPAFPGAEGFGSQTVGGRGGQILFVTLVLLLERSFSVLEVRWPRLVEALPAYTVGSLGAYWVIQRVVILLGGA